MHEQNKRDLEQKARSGDIDDVISLATKYAVQNGEISFLRNGYTFFTVHQRKLSVNQIRMIDRQLTKRLSNGSLEV